MTQHELKQIRLHRQHLTAPTDKLTVVRDLCGLQAQFLPAALHSLRIRSTDFDAATAAQGLVKNWTIRGTVHIFAEEDLPLFIHANDGRDYRSNDWRGYRYWNQREDWALTPERQAVLAETVLIALAKGPQSRDALKAICRRDAAMTEAEEESMFMAWGGGMRELCERGFCHYTVEETKTFCLTPPFTPIPEDDANLEICARYLAHMAPATLRDIGYYCKCSQKQAKAWLNALDTRTVTVEGREHFYLGDLPTDCADIPRCLFLGGFDQLMLAYEKKDSLYLPPDYLRSIFNRAGIVLPAVMVDGVVCGRWKKTGRKLEIFAFRQFDAAEKADIASAAEALWTEDALNVVFIGE